MVLSISSAVFLEGSKESIISPIKKTNDGIPNPATAADIQPTIIKALSEPEAKQYSFEYDTEGPI